MTIKMNDNQIQRQNLFKRLSIPAYRKITQCLFLGTILLIGIEFTVFVHQLEKGVVPSIQRPPGIEAFLPISSLISLKYWLTTGIFNRVHPSGLVILLMILLTAVLLKRGFCSWVCPFGLLTEYLNRIHEIAFKKKHTLPRGLDYPLRSVKYLWLAVLLGAIIVKMDRTALDYFIYSPYNMVADIKMLYFFEHISRFAIGVLVTLFILSILIRNFWCRYLCPYGALLGFLSSLSLFKIYRNPETCTNCQKCTRSCPVDIKVHQTSVVRSDECHACLNCISACPEKATVFLSVSKKNGRIRPWVYVVLIGLIFWGSSVTSRATGYWKTAISTHEYLFHVRHINLPIYQHNQGQVPGYDKSAWLSMLNRLKASGEERGD